MKIVLSVVVVTALMLSGCSQEKKEKTIVEETVVAEVATPTKAKEVIVEVVEKETVSVVDEKVEEVAVVKEAKAVKAVEKVTAPVIEKAVEMQSSVEDVTAPVIEKAVEMQSSVEDVTALDGAALYRACSSCHGPQGEKKALGKSKIIRGWDVAKTTEAIKGYAAGTYGGSMKAIMKGQASKLSDDETKAIAEYISTL